MTSLSEAYRGMCGDGFTTLSQQQLNDHDNWYRNLCEMRSKMTKEELCGYNELSPPEKKNYYDKYIEEKRKMEVAEEEKRKAEKEAAAKKERKSFLNYFW